MPTLEQLLADPQFLQLALTSPEQAGQFLAAQGIELTPEDFMMISQAGQQYAAQNPQLNGELGMQNAPQQAGTGVPGTQPPVPVQPPIPVPPPVPPDGQNQGGLGEILASLQQPNNPINVLPPIAPRPGNYSPPEGITNALQYVAQGPGQLPPSIGRLLMGR